MTMEHDRRREWVLTKPSMKKYTFPCFWLLVYIVSAEDRFNVVQCPSECTCENKDTEVECSGQGLSYIPQLPETAKKLTFVHNHLPEITAETFRNISGLNLTNLVLEYNKITNISADAFASLRHLRKLQLSGNSVPVPVLKEALFGLQNCPIESLDLSKLGLRVLLPDLFAGLNNTPIRIIRLRFNSLSVLNISLFAHLHSLEYLDFMKSNVLRLQNMATLKSLKILLLRKNKIQILPNFCGTNGSYVPLLYRLDLQSNPLDDTRFNSVSLRCLDSVTDLNLAGTTLQIIRSNTFSGMPRLEKLNLDFLRSFSKKFESYAFNSSSLKRLYLANHMNFGMEAFDYKNMFRWCPTLTNLHLGGIRLSYLDGPTLRLMLSPLRQLQKLFLRDTDLHSLPTHLFPNFEHLISLHLHNNRISSWRPNVFANMTSLKYLILSNNRITLINETSFPVEMWNRLVKLHLGNNPFSCTCDLLWFTKWTNDISVREKLFAYPDKYQCSSPQDKQGVILADFQPTDRNCFPMHHYAILGAVFGAVILIAIISGVVFYRFRWNIKYYIYMMRRRKELLSDGTGYVYDAFVAYNQADIAWVVRDMLPFLEQQESFKLCLHDRDFEVGLPIVDNIVDKMQQSRKVILVLSNSFAKSQWCQLEMMMAQHRFLDEGRNILVLVLLEDIAARHISAALHVLLTTVTYITWTPDSHGKELFWTKLTETLHRSC